MSKSVIDSNLKYDNENWVVSLLIQDDKDSSLSKNAHVQICVEGLVKGTFFASNHVYRKASRITTPEDVLKIAQHFKRLESVKCRAYFNLDS